MIKSVGIDLGGIGEHKVRCLDENAQMCDGFGFDTSRLGLVKLAERILRLLVGSCQGFSQFPS